MITAELHHYLKKCSYSYERISTVKDMDVIMTN